MFVIVQLEIVQWALGNSNPRVVRIILGQSFEMWGWNGMEVISWTDRVKNEQVLDRF
jgi:hypothetical protein